MESQQPNSSGKPPPTGEVLLVIGVIGAVLVVFAFLCLWYGCRGGGTKGPESAGPEGPHELQVLSNRSLPRPTSALDSQGQVDPDIVPRDSFTRLPRYSDTSSAHRADLRAETRNSRPPAPDPELPTGRSPQSLPFTTSSPRESSCSGEDPNIPELKLRQKLYRNAARVTEGLEGWLIDRKPDATSVARHLSKGRRRVFSFPPSSNLTAERRPEYIPTPILKAGLRSQTKKSPKRAITFADEERGPGAGYNAASERTPLVNEGGPEYHHFLDKMRIAELRWNGVL
ncbi:hypothetical protein BU26DRAFT_569271 [Trematosphaeria pertusa]|uniref:Uncharacterized protein n=1 Tax=Trematosphaeria pertusa TaxID=390896 RepID=A0A6A6I1S9_9PLEO|nr:uncharacterized protein BU26DRAFT_569271 [Trematosphaeria pertusa]KAF2244281.1 hypothetical protein BU26DRAFT_569271 [Trematosphaeria pertusa]